MGQADYYAKGDWNAICDECGFKYKGSKLRKRWDGFMVCQRCWEPRHPSELKRPLKPETMAPPFVRNPPANFGGYDVSTGYLAGDAELGIAEMGDA